MFWAWIGRGEYEADQSRHDETHLVISSRLKSVEDAMKLMGQVQQDQLAQLKDIKWLLICILVAVAPRLVELLKGVWKW